MAFGIDPGQEVDAEVVGGPTQPQTVSSPPPRAGVVNISQAYQHQGMSQPAADQLALAETRARAVGLFVQIPILSIIALHPKVPGALRFGAGVLAVWNAWQIASQEKEIETMFQVGP